MKAVSLHSYEDGQCKVRAEVDGMKIQAGECKAESDHRAEPLIEQMRHRSGNMQTKSESYLHDHVAVRTPCAGETKELSFLNVEARGCCTDERHTTNMTRLTLCKFRLCIIISFPLTVSLSILYNRQVVIV